MEEKLKKRRIGKKNTPFINQSKDSILIYGGIINKIQLSDIKIISSNVTSSRYGMVEKLLISR
jgi:hypothetical protein